MQIRSIARECPACRRALDELSGQCQSCFATRLDRQVAARRLSIKQITVASLALFVFALSIWIYVSPYLAAFQFLQSARSGNVSALCAAIDFPELKANLKPQIQAIFGLYIDAAGKEAGDTGALLAVLAGNLLLDPLVDSIVSPEGLKGLVCGRADTKEIEALLGGQAFFLRGSCPEQAHNKESLSFLAGMASGVGSREKSNVFAGRYDSPNTFVLDLPVNVREGGTVTLIFSREGISSWRLSNVEIEKLAGHILKRYIARQEKPLI